MAAQQRIPAEDRKQQILTVAIDIFARQGYKGTTTREIADAAGVNEAIIFRHFPKKEDLYWAVIEQQCRVIQPQEKVASILATTSDDFDVFCRIAHSIMDRDVTLTRLLMFSALENHELSYRFFTSYVTGYYELLSDFIREGIEKGRFRDVDPDLAARGFLGMIQYQFLIRGIYGGEDFQQFSMDEICQNLTQVWLKGLRTDIPDAGS